MNPHSTPLRFTRQARAIENSLFKKKKLQDELSGLHGDCGIVGKNQMLSTSFNQVFFCIIRALIFIPHVNSIQQLCLSCHRLLPSRSSPGEPTSVCLAFRMSVCLCVARCPVFHVICHTWCSRASPDLWSRAAERPPVAAACLVSLCTQREHRGRAQE